MPLQSIHCPVCRIPMKPLRAGDVDLDLCPRCDGVWFDSGELNLILDRLADSPAIPLSPMQDDLKDMISAPEPAGDRMTGCPRCGMPMDRRNFAYDSSLSVDKCSLCGGVWAKGENLAEMAACMRGEPGLQRYAEAICDAYAVSANPSGFAALCKAWHGWAAGVVAILYIVAGYWMDGAELAGWIALRVLPLPLILIWFGDALGRWTGGLLIRPAVIRTTPGYLLKIVGWIILIVPVLLLPFLFH